MMGTPSNFEQLVLELVNRARADPLGELEKLIPSASPIVGIQDNITSALQYFNVSYDLLASQLSATPAAAPLAWNDFLGASADQHSDLMIQYDQQSHNLPGEGGLLDRVESAGYTGLRSIAENIYAYTQDPLHGHAGFYIDWGLGPGGIQDPPGHRLSILNPEMTEIGVGVSEVANPGLNVGPFTMTQHIGTRWNADSMLVGVVIRDSDDDDFYDLGEGVGDVTIEARGSAGTFTTTTSSSGGYTLALPEGSYDVTFSASGGAETLTDSVTIGQQNVKLDADLNSINGGGEPAEPDFDLLALSISEQTAALYVGYFGRAPDPGGHSFWNDAYQAVLGDNRAPIDIMEDFSEHFRLQPETWDKYDFLNPDNQGAIETGVVRDFIEDVYTNIFNRSPSEVGLGYWSDIIETRLDRDEEVGDIVTQIILGAQDGASVDWDGDGIEETVYDASTISNKVTVANYYSEETSEDEFSMSEAISIVGSVTSDQQSVIDAFALV
ncbi:CAP domain-containing protein [Amorphus sp. 3PC139-8]|uniref:CAP domain-containing protein n=1 Tax=Amorphus sp. 3PC139-8 TaxID=2735676 RepID=UPI00345D57FC